MIHYNVWFSFGEGSDEADGLTRVRAFLDDVKARGVIQDFTLLKNRAAAGRTKLSTFHALVLFQDEKQFGESFKDVAGLGVHKGRHGFMIEQVRDFVVEVFDVLNPSGPPIT